MPRIFAESEYASRLARFQAVMAGDGIDVVVVTAPENVCWLSGHETAGYYTYQCLVVPAEGAPVLFTRETEVVNGRDTTWLDEIIGYPDVDDPLEGTVALVRRLVPRARVVGLEARSWFLVPEQYEKLSVAFEPAEVRRVDDALGRLRLIKSPAEIEQLRRSAAVTNAGVRAGALAAVPGARERDVAAVAFAEMVRQGSEYVGMEPFVASGPRAGNIHASWSDRVIKEGEGVLLEMAASVGRYHAPLMYTTWTGELTGDSARMAVACRAARDATVAMVRPGGTPAGAHQTCRDTITEHDLIHTYRKRSGYSVGIAFAPDWGEGHLLSLKETEHRPFEPGMVVHVVPTLRLAGVAGQGFSATVLVTETGGEVLTSCDVVQPGAAA